MTAKVRGVEKEVWLIIRENEITDCILTSEEAINFLAGPGDEVVPYTIKI